MAKLQQAMEALVLTAGLAVGGAQAQGQSEVTCGVNQTKIASALAGGKVVGCKDIEGATNPPTVEQVITPIQKSPQGGNVSILVAPVRNGSDSGLGVGVTLGEEGYRVRLAGEVSEDQRATLVALGYAVDDMGYVILTASQRTALLEHYANDVTATGVSIEGSLAQPMSGVHSIQGRLMHEQGHSKHLATDVDVSSVTVDDILLSSALMPDGGRRTTRTVVSTTTETTTTTDTRFAGGSRDTVTAGAKFQIAPQTLGSVSVAHTHSSLTGNQTTTALSATHYMPEKKANISLGGNNRGNVALGVQKQVADGVNLVANFAGKSKDTLSGYVGVNIEFGGKPVNPGVMPTTQQSELQNVMNTKMPSTDGVGNPDSLGKIEESRITTQAVKVVKNSSSTIQKPETEKPTPEKPPVTPPEVPPGAPICSADDTTNTITCSDAPETLEMSFGGSWIPFSATGHGGNKTVYVRKKANGAIPASPVTTLNFTEVVVTPNTPLNIGNISCTATVIQHGQTTTCQITPVDPDGIQSLRAEIGGSSLSVSQSGGTYTIAIPAGLAAGGATGALTSRTHTITVYATGKKPDGTSESEQSTSTTIEVQCQGVWINENGGICSR